jgi:osmotically-inducible protein OsmY
MRKLHGVLGVRNSIRITPRAAAGDIKRRIEEAFQRNALIDARRITVEAKGDEVTLRGEVHSWAEHDQAQRTAWSAPGIAKVRNELTIRT